MTGLIAWVIFLGVTLQGWVHENSAPTQTRQSHCYGRGCGSPTGVPSVPGLSRGR